jgi:hypothetical protein
MRVRNLQAFRVLQSTFLHVPLAPVRMDVLNRVLMILSGHAGNLC